MKNTCEGSKVDLITRSLEQSSIVHNLIYIYKLINVTIHFSWKVQGKDTSHFLYFSEKYFQILSVIEINLNECVPIRYFWFLQLTILKL